ncbi:FAD binding domain-containing protein [Garciella nitratireducens]|uniref:FAD binding domain-containing protein n=1 Tax=Garciella nitratireducens TaxID=218205 RepID=UPI000DFFBAAB|nr:molybdopterin-dependent oxidoreductase-like protein [Garciella nitratireducens]
MFTIKRILQPNSINEDYNTLMYKKGNVILEGCAFLRLSSKNIVAAIDLSKLELEKIKDQVDYIEVGAYVTFGDLETHPLLIRNFNGIISKAVENIIEIQFRNIVTVGASVFSKYSFSDFLTALLSLNTEIELYKAGRTSLKKFLERSYEKDILSKIYKEK